MSLNRNYKIRSFTWIKHENDISTNVEFSINLDKLIKKIIKRVEEDEKKEVFDFTVAIDNNNVYHIIIKYKLYE